MKTKHYTKKELKQLTIEELRDLATTANDIYAKNCYTDSEREDIEIELYARYAMEEE